MRLFTASILLITTLIASSIARTIHVPLDQPTIQIGLNVANEGDTVLVAEGTYYENIIWQAVNGVKLIGAGQEDCIIDGGQLSNVIRFRFELGGIIDTTTMISGFAIQNGLYSYDYFHGGGIHCSRAGPIIRDVILRDNYSLYGGGIYCNHQPGAHLQNVVISGNTAFHGGGVANISSSIRMENVSIYGNTAYEEGGGVSCGRNSPTLIDVNIYDNSAEIGGGIWCGYESTLFLEGVSIFNNSASESGGGLYCWYSAPHLQHVTFSSNNGDYALVTFGAHTVLENCILWDTGAPEIKLEDWSSISIRNSDIQGGEEGIETNYDGIVHWLENNISIDPLFCAPAYHDYRIDSHSRCRTDACGIMGLTGETCEGEVVGAVPRDCPAEFYLAQNYPNPFNPTTTIEFSIPYPQDVQLMVYNILGQQVAVLVDGMYTAGMHRVMFDTQSFSVGAGSPRPLPSGVYVCRLVAGKNVNTRKMLLVR